MRGTLRLKAGRPPVPMVAEQVLAPPRGFVWKARVGTGLRRIEGYDRYDGRGELRWWLLGRFSIVHQSGPNVDRSAAGRLGGEAALVPAALLRHASWESIDAANVRARIGVHGEKVSLTLRVAEDGRLEQVVIARWNGDPRNGDVGYRPFVVTFSGESFFEGYTVPARLTAGWAEPGSDVADPFITAELDDVHFR